MNCQVKLVFILADQSILYLWGRYMRSQIIVRCFLNEHRSRTMGICKSSETLNKLTWGTLTHSRDTLPGKHECYCPCSQESLFWIVSGRFCQMTASVNIHFHVSVVHSTPSGSPFFSKKFVWHDLLSCYFQNCNHVFVFLRIFPISLIGVLFSWYHFITYFQFLGFLPAWLTISIVNGF